MNAKNMNVVGTWGKYVRHDESNFKEKAKYLDKVWKIFEPRDKGTIRLPRTRGKVIKVITIIGIGTGIR